MLVISNLYSFCFSSCSDGQWKCESETCANEIQCPGNQIYSTNASSCTKTCDNMYSNLDCTTTTEGCTCPTGQVLSQDVSLNSYIQ